MYSFIEGNIAEITPTYVVLETGGIGYHIEISLTTYEKIQKQNRAKLYTHAIIRNEGANPVGFGLYGFCDTEERRVFLLLTSVSGVGYNTARMILSSLSADDVKSAIISSDVGLLKKIKGIGEKTAQRIIVDLKDKIAKEGFVPDLYGLAVANVSQEALAALMALGVAKNVAEKAIDKVIKSEKRDINLEELIKLALKNL